MRADRQTEHFKPRGDAEGDLPSIEKMHEDQATAAKTKEIVAELVAANAATQATVSAIAADNASIKALLTQLIQMQVQAPTDTAYTKLKTETETKTETDKTETETETETELNTELQRMGVLQDNDSLITHSHDLPVTAIFTELENINVLSYTDHHQHADSD